MPLFDWVKNKLGIAPKTVVAPVPTSETILSSTPWAVKTEKPFRVVPESTTPTSSDFNPGDFISSQEFIDTSALSEAQIQDFLKSKNSFLQDYKINGHLMSYWIYKHCSDNGLNPKVIITHAQKEQGLISQTTMPTKQRRLDYALGVGATDGGDNPKWKGMDNQFLGGTQTCTRWYLRGEKQNKYPLIFAASDNSNLVIHNSAVFSLYKFCPWQGTEDKLIGKVIYKAPFGNYLFWKVYKKYFG
jgi:hypothetical protein